MEFLLNFNTWYKGLPAGGKLSLFIVIIGVFIAGLLLQSHYKSIGYQYLYTNLSLSDANAIAARLQSMNVQAKIQGDAVLVPGDRVLELRNTLSGEGLPHGGGVGFEIFDQKNFGETEFQQHINYMRAIQGELARTITAIDGVEKARVHIVIPEKPLFKEDQKPPSASIAITLMKGRALSEGQIRGVVHMVMTAVEGLTEESINVIDQNGNVLFKARDDKSGLSASQVELQSGVEQKYEKNVRDLLENIVGTGGVSVKVTTVMNTQTIERMVESVDPESRVALSENTTTETSSGSRGAPGGTPGAAANLPEGGGSSSSSGSSENSKKIESSTNYTMTKTTQKIVEPMGAVQKLSVAVLVDGNYTTAEDGTKTYAARTDDELKKLEELVKKAVGFNEKRGDEVKVENMQFKRDDKADLNQEAFVQATNSSRWTMFLLDNVKLVSVVLILGVIFLLLVKTVNSYSPPIHVAYANILGQEAGRVADALPAKAAVNIIQRDNSEAKAKQEALAAQVPELVQRRDAGEINFVETQKSITVEQMTTSEEKLRLQAAKMQTEAIIKGDLNEAVSIVRAWLNEG